MSQRNPMNERYTTDLKSGGSSRKSAASAKPKSSAASSVVMGSKKKSKDNRENKRNQKREQRNKEYQNEKKYGEPPWKKFKIMKKLWIASLVCSVATVAASFAVSKIEGAPEGLGFGFIIAAYVFIIITLYIDLGQIRRMRKKWVAQMANLQTKESRAEQKKARAEARQAAKEAEAKKALEDQENSNKPQTLLDKIKKFFIGK